MTKADQAVIYGLVQKLAYLYDRWQDEKEYEDFEEYRKVFAASLPAGETLVDMRSRPMTATFTMNGVTYRAKVGSRGVEMWELTR